MVAPLEMMYYMYIVIFGVWLDGWPTGWLSVVQMWLVGGPLEPLVVEWWQAETGNGLVDTGWLWVDWCVCCSVGQSVCVVGKVTSSIREFICTDLVSLLQRR